MKQLIVSIILASILVTSQAAENNTNSNWSVSDITLSSQVANQYLAFGSGTVLYDKPVLHSDLRVNLQNGIYFDLWNSTPLNTGWGENYGSEVDYGVGWNGPLSKLGVTGPLSDLGISIGTSYFDEPKVGSFGGGDTLYSHLTVTKSFTHLSVSAEFENYLTMPETGIRGGNLYSIGASKSMSFFKDRLSATTSLAAVYDSGGYGMDKGFLLRGFAELDWNVTKKFTVIIPQLFYYIPVTVNDRQLDAMVYVGIRYKFW